MDETTYYDLDYWRVLLAAALIPFFSSFLYDVIMHGQWPEHWQWGEGLFFSLPLLFVTVIAWFSPLLGGGLAVVAGLLGIFLGPLGVHRMYLGFVGIGILQIIVTFVTLGIGGVWGFIEGVLCLCGAMRDVDGLPLRE